MRTFSPKDSDITRQWHVVDASDVVLGRLAKKRQHKIRLGPPDALDLLDERRVDARGREPLPVLAVVQALELLLTQDEPNLPCSPAVSGLAWLLTIS